ncbi:hypothetical protein [Caldisericum sp.]|uniref:hypothetical protein n=1 Tax=Caldisericum sp. TaxID=2499687 RepID=UPI003D12FFD0
MNNVKKALAIIASAVAILFFYTVIKQAEHEALMERESARFDTLFSEFAKSNILPENNTFFEDIQKRAKKEERETQKRLEEKRKECFILSFIVLFFVLIVSFSVFIYMMRKKKKGGDSNA